MHFNKMLNLQKIVTNYRQTLRQFNRTKELKKALDAGAISLINYLVEIQFYYDTIDKTKTTELELQKSIAWLKQWD